MFLVAGVLHELHTLRQTQPERAQVHFEQQGFINLVYVFRVSVGCFSGGQPTKSKVPLDFVVQVVHLDQVLADEHRGVGALKNRVPVAFQVAKAASNHNFALGVFVNAKFSDLKTIN